MEMTPIAHIETDLPQKFGIPRNSFLAPHLQGRIVFEPEFALPQAVAGLEEFSHLWLLWEFENGTPGGTAADIAVDAATASKPGAHGEVDSHPCARPVWAAPSVVASLPRASPLSAQSHRSDLREARPHRNRRRRPRDPRARRGLARRHADFRHQALHPPRRQPSRGHGGWIDRAPWQELEVDFPAELRKIVPSPKLAGLIEVLRQDPRRAGSKHEPERVYHLAYAGLDVAFTVDGESLHVADIT